MHHRPRAPPPLQEQQPQAVLLDAGAQGGQGRGILQDREWGGWGWGHKRWSGKCSLGDPLCGVIIVVGVFVGLVSTGDGGGGGGGDSMAEAVLLDKGGLSSDNRTSFAC